MAANTYGSGDHASGGDGRYPPIRDFALIGDCHGCALVGVDGSVEWCALMRFDADPVFCRILDAERGGCWSIRPPVEFSTKRSYLGATNLLRTVFTTAQGSVAVTDFMPVGRRLDARTHDYVNLSAPGWLIRRVEGLQGRTPLRVVYKPSRDFVRRAVRLEQSGAAIGGEGVPSLYSDITFAVEGDTARAELILGADECRDFVLALNTVDGQSPLSRVPEFFAVTRAFWEEWIEYCRYRGPYAKAVTRSALTLKLLTYAPTGAIVAAPTTSLPEGVGGERNWDYRYCWLRDSCFSLYALAALGYSGEARRFHGYLVNACRQTLPEIQIMYGIGWEHRLDEQELDHLEGYRGSTPVRTGNAAYQQRQIDVYGHALDLALMYRTLGGRLDEQYRRLLLVIARFVEKHWREPDQGLWEMRGPPRHHVHGKMMSWVAMDRASRLVDRTSDWAELARQIAREVRGQGVDRHGGHLRQAYDGGVDAAVLLAPMLGFALEDTTLERTIDAVEAALGRGGYLLRYEGEDGLSGDEGAFLTCSFWLVDAKLAAGRVAEARELFERLLAQANDLGLYAEEIDPGDGSLLGNFPQALTHLALVGSAVNLRLVERHGYGVLLGTYADRARRAVGTTFGWRAVLASVLQCGRRGRVLPSRKSKLAWP